MPTKYSEYTKIATTLNNKFIGTQDLQRNTLQNANILDYSEKVNSLGDITGSVTIDMSIGNIVTANVTGNITFTFTNPSPAGTHTGFMIYLSNGGSHTLTWPSNVKWSNGINPTLTTTGIDILTFTTKDIGVTWNCLLLGLDNK